MPQRGFRVRKKQKHFAANCRWPYLGIVQTRSLPLEDELGDVLEKGLRCAGIPVETLAAEAGVTVARLRDALDYRSDLDAAELGRVARILGLNEVGLAALAGSGYPLPEIGALPFCVNMLSMRHGIGVANAYLVSECGSDRGLLFDVGPGLAELTAAWPANIRRLEAIFLTHAEPEHSGGFCEVVRRHAPVKAYHPRGLELPCGSPLDEPTVLTVGGFTVTVLSTPGHALAHNCYLVRARSAPAGAGLLVAGDLIFAGSAGGPYHCPKQAKNQLRRVMQMFAPVTVIAPGHGPMTTVGHERRYNPFLP
jgi:glyoxylase-like metal-dependent hydrolase (beta-lactamase superfamily II)